MPQIVEIIKRLRAAGLSQTEIARKTGIPQPRVSRWESGNVAKGADDALKLIALESEICGPKQVVPNDTELINSLGGPTKVAEMLHLKKEGGVQRVQNWLTRGIPSKVKLDFPAIFLRDGLPPISAEVDAIKPLDELMAEAIQAGRLL